MISSEKDPKSKIVPEQVVEALEDLRSRTHVLPLPPEGFDPLKAGPGELRHYGLPVPQDFPEDSPGHIARRTFLSRPESGEPLRFIQAFDEQPLDSMLLDTLSDIPEGAAWPAETSLNWSGGYVEPRNAESIVTVFGTWTVPRVALPTGGTQPRYESSTWIGLDGMRAYLDSSLPQIGTSQVWNAATGAAEYKAWYQWWSRDSVPVIYEVNMPGLDAGHEIYAIIAVQNPTTVLLSIKNVTLGTILQTFTVTAPGPCVISGATAEWIMERPSPFGSDGWGAYPLPSYSSFSFTGCLAESVAPGSIIATSIDLELARLIRMYEIVPPGTRTISTANKVLSPQQRIDMTYLGP